MNKIMFVLASVFLCFGIGARAGNVVTIGTVSGVPGDEVTVSIGLTNTDAVAALQVLLPLGEQLSYVEGSVALGSRCSSHSVTAGVKDGALSLMIYSLNMTAFSAGEGEVASFRLKLGNQPSDIVLAASKVLLTDTDGNSIADATATGGSVSIRCARAQYSTTKVDFGSVPIRSTYHRSVQVTNTGNEPLTISGLQFSSYPTRFSSDTSFPLTVEAGSSTSIDIRYEPDARGTVKETVKVVCNSISKLNSITLAAQPFAVNELHIQPAEGLSDETVTVAMTMNNMDAISGFQLEFTLPEALTYVTGSFALSGRKQNHSVVESLSNGTLRILCYSPDDTAFTGEDGTLATMQLRLTGRNSATLKASKCLLTATIDNVVTDVCSADYGATVTIRSPRINANNKLEMGATPVTEDAMSALTVRNYGNAPLILSRVVFADEGFAISEDLPVTIEAWGSKELTVVYPSKTEGDYSTTMHIYSNDPEQRLLDVSVTGNRFAPNYLSFAAKDVLAGQDVSVDVSMSNYDAVNGLQFDVEYPSDYYEPTSELTTTARAAGLTVTEHSIATNTVRYFFYSLSDAAIAAGDGQILTFTLHAKGNAPEGEYALQVKNIILGTPAMANKYAGDMTDEVTFQVVDRLTIVLDENSTVPPEASDGAVNVRMKRTIKAGEWSTICLPFAMTTSQMTAAFGEDVELEDFTGVEATYDDAGENIIALTLKFRDATSIEANHPYILKVSEPVAEFTVEDVVVEPDEAAVNCDRIGQGTMKDPYLYNSFIGTYVAQTELAAMKLFLDDNTFYYSTGQTKMQAFRGYFDFYHVLTAVEEAHSKVVMVFNIDDVATGIEGRTNDGMTGDECFDLAGRRVAKPQQRGLYVMDGRKVVVK
ncbi:MAG: choice-of-anchor D domain-containing protein [Bacteroidaceae bacterium]|nr:choice-of-anchor D domain-containing protein [Bacteroidaceae bacterium]